MDKTVSDEEFKSALRLFASGVTVITWAGGAQGVEGITVSAFSSLSLAPPLVLFCIDRSARVYAELATQEYVAVNILAAGQAATAYFFAGRERENVRALLQRDDDSSLPLLRGARANLIVRIEEKISRGDHDIFIAAVCSIRIFPERAPLLYYDSTLRDGAV